MTRPTTSRPQLAVVIPALNEAIGLPGTLASLRTQTEPQDRVIVVDGGSTDGTRAVAEAAGAEVMVATGRGRGGQIAAGVRHVAEEIVLAGHADMIFPPTAVSAIREWMTLSPRSPGGCLGHRFDSSKWVYRIIEFLDRLRARRGDSYGDQAQFFRREWLIRAGGFPDQPIMEDVELSRRLRTLGRLTYLDLPVMVSARRFEQRGWWNVMWANWSFRRAYQRNGVAACRTIYERYYGRPWPYSLHGRD